VGGPGSVDTMGFAQATLSASPIVVIQIASRLNRVLPSRPMVGFGCSAASSRPAAQR
jgi:hypothetical protein